MSSQPEATSSQLQPVGLQTAALAMLTVTLWGANPVAVSFSVDTLPPVAVAAVRFTMATVFMFFWCRVERSSLGLRRGQRAVVLWAGIGLFVQITLFNIGVTMSNSSHASMMINTFVLWVVLIEHFVTRQDRLTLRKFVGLLLAFSGVVLLLLRAESREDTAELRDVPTLLGDAILLLSAFVLSLKIVYTKHALKVVEPGKLIFWHNLTGVVLFCAYSALFEQVQFAGFTTAAVLALIYQGIFVAGICFAVQARLLRHHSASQIAVFSFVTPIVGVASGALLRGDRLTPLLFAAAAFVALGILLVNLPAVAKKS